MDKYSNHIYLVGRICSDITFSHNVYDEKFYSFKVEVERLSDTTDILPVLISERLLKRSAVTQNDLVRITGQLRSYNKQIQTEKRHRLLLAVFVLEITLAPENLDYVPNDIFLNGYMCRAPIYRVTPFGREITDLLLAVNRQHNRSDYIPCIAWNNNAREIVKLTVGNNLRLWGRMQSRRYQKRRENDTFTDETAYEVSITKYEVLS